METILNRLNCVNCISGVWVLVFSTLFQNCVLLSALHTTQCKKNNKLKKQNFLVDLSKSFSRSAKWFCFNLKKTHDKTLIKALESEQPVAWDKIKVTLLKMSNTDTILAWTLLELYVEIKLDHDDIAYS